MIEIEYKIWESRSRHLISHSPTLPLSLFILILVVLSLLPRSAFAQEVTVRRLQFRGNSALSSGSLGRAINTRPRSHRMLFWRESPHYQEPIFLNDLLRVEKFYHEEGFLEARVTDYTVAYNEAGDAVDIVISIDEGRATVVTETGFVSSTGDSLPVGPPFLLENMRLTAGKRYRETDLRSDYNTIITLFGNRGYPYIEARVKPVVNHERHTVALTWILSPGPFCTFGAITVTGNAQVSERVIRRGIDFRVGDRFEQRRLPEAQSRIYGLGLFNTVSLQTGDIAARPITIPIEIAVTEQERRTLKLGVGYGSEEALRVSTDWIFRNIWGGARTLRTELKHATNVLPLHAAFVFNQPYFLGDRNDLTVKPFFIWQDERSFEARRLGLEMQLIRQMTNHTQLFTTARVERDTVRVKASTTNAALNDLYNKSILQAGLIRTTTDHPFWPGRGSQMRLTIEEAGFPFRSRFRYYKLWGEYRTYKPVGGGGWWRCGYWADSCVPTARGQRRR